MFIDKVFRSPIFRQQVVVSGHVHFHFRSIKYSNFNGDLCIIIPHTVFVNFESCVYIDSCFFLILTRIKFFCVESFFCHFFPCRLLHIYIYYLGCFYIFIYMLLSVICWIRYCNTKLLYFEQIVNHFYHCFNLIFYIVIFYSNLFHFYRADFIFIYCLLAFQPNLYLR